MNDQFKGRNSFLTNVN